MRVYGVWIDFIGFGGYGLWCWDLRKAHRLPITGFEGTRLVWGCGLRVSGFDVACVEVCMDWWNFRVDSLRFADRVVCCVWSLRKCMLQEEGKAVQASAKHVAE